jgi:two-component system OmpR family response regulator
VRLLVVEDDKALSQQLAEGLTKAGYTVDCALDGEEGHFLGDTEPYDAVVLDLGLPKMDGASVLKTWRKDGRAMPVLILTARDSWSEKVAGFDAGADDYLAKPFHMEELLARLRALIRRTAGHASPLLELGDLAYDTRSGQVTLCGRDIALTSHESKILGYLMHHPGKAVSRTELTEHVYAQDFDRDSNTIEVFIARLRRKLGEGWIRTQRGIGYRLAQPGDAPDA